MVRGWTGAVLLLAAAMTAAGTPAAGAPAAGVPVAGAPAAGSSNAGKAAAPQHLLVDVTVTDAQGRPAMDLSPLDFHLMDNGVAQRVLAVQKAGWMVPGAATAPEMVLVLDAVNLSFEKMQLERQDVQDFLRRDGGRLPVPTRVAMLTDTKLIESAEPTTDGNRLAKFIDRNPNPVHSLRFQAGYYGELDRATWSMDQLYKLAQGEQQRPGRKLVVWISHGWHPLSRDYLAMSKEDLQRDYDMVVGLTNALLRARITLVSLDPILDLPGENLNYYKAFLPPVTSWQRVDTPNLQLQVLARHSGGMVLDQSTNIEGEIRQAMQVLRGWYTLAYTPTGAAAGTAAGAAKDAATDQSVFHAIQVTVGGGQAAGQIPGKIMAPVGYYRSVQ